MREKLPHIQRYVCDMNGALSSTCHARKVSWGHRYFFSLILFVVRHFTHGTCTVHTHARRPSIKVKHSVNYASNIAKVWRKMLNAWIVCCQWTEIAWFGVNLISIGNVDNVCTICTRTFNQTIDFKTVNFHFIYISISKTEYLTIKFFVLVSCHLISWFEANNLSIQNPKSKKRIHRQNLNINNKKEVAITRYNIRNSEWECKGVHKLTRYIVLILLCFNLYWYKRWIDFIQWVCACVACVVCKQMIFSTEMWNSDDIYVCEKGRG